MHHGCILVRVLLILVIVSIHMYVYMHMYEYLIFIYFLRDRRPTFLGFFLLVIYKKTVVEHTSKKLCYIDIRPLNRRIRGLSRNGSRGLVHIQGPLPQASPRPLNHPWPLNGYLPRLPPRLFPSCQEVAAHVSATQFGLGTSY